MAKASIIIRTKNEEKWVGHCLKMVFAQTHKDFEAILVDNESADHTIEVAKRFPGVKILTISQFKPGFAINQGIRASSGEFIVCLSAHCVPQSKTWLENLIRNFDDAKVAGVYGRQLPLSFSEPSDKRDLLITFGLDKRVQLKDYFFHNANSMIRREIWEKYPFDEAATNIEDRIWGKAVIEAGYKLVYEPEAAVYHHHGIHQDNNPKRAQSVVSVMERFDKEAASGLPDSLRAENSNIAAVLPVLGAPKSVAGQNLLSNLIKELKKSKYAKSIHVLGEHTEAKKIAQDHKVNFILRPDELSSKTKTIEDVLQYALLEIERKGDYPEVILYANCLHPFRPAGLFDELIEDLQYKGLDTVFTGYTDYQNIWVKDANGAYSQIGDGFKSREHKNPLYESLYGLGCASASHIIRAGRLVGDRVGILPLEDRLYTLRNTDKRSENLIAAILEKYKEE